MRAVARNVHIGFMVTGIPSKSFGKGLDRGDVSRLGSEIREPARDPSPCNEQGELRYLTVEQ